MPRLLQLSDEEVKIIEQHRLKAEQPYIDFMMKFKPGQYGELALEEGEDQRTMRRKISAAAAHTNLVIQWRYDDPKNMNAHGGRFTGRNIFKVTRYKDQEPKPKKKIPGAGSALGLK